VIPDIPACFQSYDEKYFLLKHSLAVKNMIRKNNPAGLLVISMCLKKTHLKGI